MTAHHADARQPASECRPHRLRWTPFVNVLVLLGSLRADSDNLRLAQAAIAALPEGVHGRMAAGLESLPFYSEDLDGPAAPASVRELRATVAEADAILLVTPEYNGSIPAVVKNAIDWASRPRGTAAIAGKPAAVLAASGSPRAAQWAREHAQRVLQVAGADVLDDTVGIGSSRQAFDTAGRLGHDDAQAVQALVHALVARSLVPA